MITGMIPSRDSHQALTVLAGPVTPAQAGLTANDNAANTWLCQVTSATGLNVTCNAGTAATSAIGFYFPQYGWFTLTREELQNTKWFSAGTSVVQIAGVSRAPFPHII
jgi:hypothetical protein